MDLSTRNTSENLLSTNDENYSTQIPPDVNTPVLSIVLIALAVVFTIGLLFGLAVFIDCRHQKLIRSGKKEQERRLFNISMPKFFKFRRFSNEEDSFADKIYEEGNGIA